MSLFRGHQAMFRYSFGYLGLHVLVGCQTYYYSGVAIANQKITYSTDDRNRGNVSLHDFLDLQNSPFECAIKPILACKRSFVARQYGLYCKVKQILQYNRDNQEVTKLVSS